MRPCRQRPHAATSNGNGRSPNGKQPAPTRVPLKGQRARTLDR